MFRNLRRLFHCSRATAAVETAIFAPIFLVLMLGITDLGAGMFVRMQVNAAAQAGATYAVLNSSTTGVEQAMNDASGNPSFCTSAVCTPSIGVCADGSPHQCIIVTANYPYTPLLPDAVYAWASAQNYSSTVTVRIQ
jgi:Flp pilus assembly protein TadG